MGLREKRLIHQIVHENAPNAGKDIGTAYNSPPIPFHVEEASLEGLSEESLYRFISGAFDRLFNLMS